jgi:hypothetical protein
MKYKILPPTPLIEIPKNDITRGELESFFEPSCRIIQIIDKELNDTLSEHCLDFSWTYNLTLANGQRLLHSLICQRAILYVYRCNDAKEKIIQLHREIHEVASKEFIIGIRKSKFEGMPYPSFQVILNGHYHNMKEVWEMLEASF